MTILSAGFVVWLVVAHASVGPDVRGDADLGQAFVMGVRPTSVSVAGLVAEGRDRSATFRKLVEDLDVSGWIIFVQEGACRLPGVHGCLLHRVGMFEGRRYLRIVLSHPPAAREQIIATIGHELQHAAEVVSDERVESAADVSELYRRIGYVSMRTAGGQLYETHAAVQARVTILQELRRGRRTLERARTASR